MTNPRFLVTGSTGGTGLEVTKTLLAHGKKVRAMVHKEDGRSMALRNLGAEIIVADAYDPDQLFHALQDVQGAYFVPLMEPFMIQSATAFFLAAKEAKVEHIVQMSQWTSHRYHPTAMTQQTWLIDKLFSSAPNIAHTIFNPGMFAHNFLRTIDFAALLGIYPMISGEGKAAPISNEDMGKTVAALLEQGPERHNGKSYRPTGPELLNAREMAAIVEKAVGHRVIPINMPFWILGKVAQQQGIDPYQLACLRHYMEDMKNGTFSFEGGVTSVVQDLTGVPAENFETTARRYANLPFAKQTFNNRLKAFVNFNLVPFYPGYNFDKWEKKMGLPMPAQATLSVQDENWRITHSIQMKEKI
jgi:uncharacterized protein YbjT (DUF2867 family)